MSSPSPSSPAAAEATKKMTLNMFFEQERWQINHSLFAVEIPNDPLIAEISDEPTPISPTLSFRLTHFPSGMRCVEFGSKFYFLGGKTLMDSEVTYSPNVFIFDPATTTPNTNLNLNAFDFVTPGPPMNTGKTYPLLLFVAYGKLYALSSPVKYLKGLLLEYFEAFDPNTNTWAPLPPPPFEDYDLGSHAVIKTKFYIMAEPFYPGARPRVFCFHLDKNEWEPSIPLAISPNLNCHQIFVSNLMADIVQDKDTLYGFGHFNHSLFALAPSQHQHIDDGNGQYYFNRLIPISQKGEGIVPQSGPSGTLVHLGNRRFCYVLAYNPYGRSASTTQGPS